jgi:NitT/TauT family transport system permease protein
MKAIRKADLIQWVILVAFTGAILFAWEMFINQKAHGIVPKLDVLAKDFSEHWREYYSKLTWKTLRWSIVGLLVATVWAFAVAFAQNVLPVSTMTCRIYMTALKSTPAVALVPILMMFSCGPELVRILTATALCAFPLYLGVLRGIDSAPSGLIRFSEQLGSSRLRILWFVKSNYAIYGFLHGLQEAVPLAFIGVLVAEILGGGPTGLGHQLIKGPSEDWAGVLSVVLICCAVSIIGVMGSHIMTKVWSRYKRINE